MCLSPCQGERGFALLLSVGKGCYRYFFRKKSRGSLFVDIMFQPTIAERGTGLAPSPSGFLLNGLTALTLTALDGAAGIIWGGMGWNMPGVDILT